jgi:predicted phosphodiesterase
LNLLCDNGGVITSGDFALTEDLSWLKEISRNIYALRGNKGVKPQVAGFYSPYYSTKPKKENIKSFWGMV